MRHAYRAFGYFGLASIFGALLFGFHYDAHAPWGNYLFDIVLYAAWAAVHLAMTRTGFKHALYGTRAGSPIERQVYIVVTVVSWLAVLWLHRPVSGGAIDVPDSLRFAGTVGVVLCILAFFEGITFAMLDGLLGVPSTALVLSHGQETPLLTEGQYARVRHPMYRAAILAGLCSIVIHFNAAQILWCVMIAGTFIGFIPIEETQLRAARGEAYRAYVQRTPWRLMPGIW